MKQSSLLNRGSALVTGGRPGGGGQLRGRRHLAQAVGWTEPPLQGLITLTAAAVPAIGVVVVLRARARR